MGEAGISLEQALALSLDELHLAIGDELSRNMKGATPLGPKQKEAVGSAWAASMMKSLSEKVCQSELLKRLFIENADERELVVAVLSLITSVVVGVSPVLVACLLVRRGLMLLCRDLWQRGEIGTGTEQQ